jgi:hypothetical protein
MEMCTVRMDGSHKREVDGYKSDVRQFSIIDDDQPNVFGV